MDSKRVIAPPMTGKADRIPDNVVPLARTHGGPLAKGFDYDAERRARSLFGRLRWAERGLDGPWNADLSLALDQAIIDFEAATASGGER